MLVFLDDVRADHIGGHEVGGELDAVELKAQRLGQRANERGFAQAWHAFEQRVAADEQAREHAVDDLVMTDDRLGDLRLDRAVIAPKRVGRGLNLRINTGNVSLGHVSSCIAHKTSRRLPVGLHRSHGGQNGIAG